MPLNCWSDMLDESETREVDPIGRATGLTTLVIANGPTQRLFSFGGKCSANICKFDVMELIALWGTHPTSWERPTWQVAQTQ